MTRILALSPIPEEGAGCRFRVAQFIPELRRAGFDVTIHPLFDLPLFRMVYRPGHLGAKTAQLIARTMDRLTVVRDRAAYDMVLLYREAYPIGPPYIERYLARRGVPMIYDFDDAVYLPNTSDANRMIASLKNHEKVGEILSLCTEVIAGNAYLADYAKHYASSVTVIPTCVDTSVWVPRPDARGSGPLVIGWIGTPTTTPYLLTLRSVLTDLAKTHNFILRISGSVAPIEIPGVTVQNEPWTLEREVELFNTCDVGVYPLPDDAWTLGKCGFKAIQFMSCGVPIVAAPVGVNREIVVDGVSGWLAGTPDQWLSSLRRLMDDAALRARLGAAGRQRIIERYSLAANAPRVAEVFKRAAANLKLASAEATAGQRAVI